MDPAQPKDRWNLIFMTLLLHGLGTLTAWNMFITAKDYFVKYKLAGTPYSASFLVYIGYASQLPNFFFSWFNVFVTLGGNLSVRILGSLFCEVVIFVVTVILAMADSTEWTSAFFCITIVCVFCLNALNAVFQNSVFGVAARLPPKYMGAVVLGSNICGTLVVLLGWLSDSFGGSLRTSAIYYFIGGMIVLILCFDTYLALPLNKFYRYNDKSEQRNMGASPALATTNQNASPSAPARTPYGTILKQCWVQLYNVFIVFFVSLAVFPAVLSDITPVTPGFLGNNFMRITCFLTFSITAVTGNVTASLWQIPNRRWLALFTTTRILFIPFFLLCNYHPLGRTRTLPVLVTSDAAYWAMAMLMGWSSGHGSSLGMMYVGGNVAPEYVQKAGMLGGACLVSGILAGVTFSGVGPGIVS